MSDVRASDRLTDSAVCLVAPESGPDRQLEKLLAGAGRLTSARSRSWRSIRGTSSIVALAALGEDERAFKEDAAHLLFDEARVLDGERPTMRAPSPSGWRGCSGAACPSTTPETLVTQGQSAGE